MSGEIVNLRRVRKAARRAKAETEAAASRITCGESAAERERLKAEKDRGVRHLDQHRRTPTKS